MTTVYLVMNYDRVAAVCESFDAARKAAIEIEWADGADDCELSFRSLELGDYVENSKFIAKLH